MSVPAPVVLRECLKDVIDPELGYNIVDLGLVYDIGIEDSTVHITMTLTTPGCPASDMIQDGVRRRLLEEQDVGTVDINLVWEPPWSPQAMSPAAKAYFGFAG